MTDLVPADPGSIPLKRANWEAYAKARAMLFAHPAEAARQAGLKDGCGACTRLERNQEVQARIAYLSRKENDIAEEVRQQCIRDFFTIKNADIGEFYEVRESVVGYRKNGDAIIREVQLPKYFKDMTREQRMAVESYTTTESGKPNLKLYSRKDAAQEICKILGIYKPVEGPANEDDAFKRLTTAEKYAILAQEFEEMRKLAPLLDVPDVNDGASEPSPR